METLGYLASALIGLSLGLIGGGGSTLTVPVLVYLFGINATSATGYSLFIVGATALVGAVFAAKRGHVDFKTGALFAVPAFIGVYTVRRFAIPSIPDQLFAVGAVDVTRDAAILVLFGALMLATAFSMIRKNGKAEEKDVKINYLLIMVEGLVVGAVTGLIGAGGGFLIVPALVLLAGLPMKTAVGTSLMVIAAKSLLGFVGDVQSNPNIDWQLLGVVTAIAVTGILVGGMLSKKIPGAKLKPAFGWFILAMGVFLVGNTLLTGN